MEDRDKYLDKPGLCFGWCKLPDDGTIGTFTKQIMCSCKCSSWGACGMANTPPYNTAFDNIKINTPLKKSQKHKKRKQKS